MSNPSCELDLLRSWLIKGREKGAQHALIVYDRADLDVFMLYVYHDVRQEVERISRETGVKVLEVYDLTSDLDRQLYHEPRAYHLD